MNLADFQAANSPQVDNPLYRFAQMPSRVSFPQGGSTMGIASPRQQTEAQRIRQTVQDNVITPAVNAVTDPFYAATPGMDQRRQDARRRVLEKIYQGVTDPFAATFAGVGAKMADKAALAKSLEMKAAGIADREIWKETGWTHAFPDGKPRFEIPDNSAKMLQQNNSQLVESQYNDLKDAIYRNEDILRRLKEYGTKFTDGSIDAKQLIEASNMYKHIEQKNKGLNSQIDNLYSSEVEPRTYKLGDTVEHPQLYENYPDTYNYSSQYTNEPGARYGGQEVTLGKMAGESDALHEIQHAVQEKEGFARGGSNEEPDYRSLAGEVEARLTQRRMDLDAAQRRERYPIDEMDVKPEDQIVRFGNGTAMSSNAPSLEEGKSIASQLADFNSRSKYEKPDLREMIRLNGDWSKFLKSIPETNAVGIETGYGQAILHKSTKKPDTWQMSRFDKNGEAIGDSEYNSFQSGIKDLSWESGDRTQFLTGLEKHPAYAKVKQEGE